MEQAAHLHEMGIQVHSTAHYRIASQVMKDGALGKIREVHSWCAKSWGDMGPKPDQAAPVPDGFDWNLWSSEHLKFDVPQANAFVRRGYREGWKIPGLG